MASTVFLGTFAPGQIDTIVLDAVISEQHGLQNTVTSHPVEQGAPISDHSRPEALQFTMDCFVSDTPLSKDQRDRVTAAISSPTGDQPTFDFDSSQRSPTAKGPYSKIVYAQLLDLHDNPRLITVVTSLRTYNNMTVENVGIPRDAGNVNGLRFSVTLREVIIVQNQVATKKAKAPQAHKKQKQGAKTTPPASDSDDSLIRKPVRDIANKLGISLG